MMTSVAGVTGFRSWPSSQYKAVSGTLASFLHVICVFLYSRIQ